jgi:hypothetical protein
MFIRHLALLTSPLALLLASCGGSSSPSTSTAVAGVVAKGPVSGSQVCAFAIAANVKGSAAGSCTTTDASGNYTLNIPAIIGDFLIEATGGTYIDETTLANTTLPASSTLTGLVSANGGNAAAMLTPLTTLALNSAKATGTLSASSYQAAVSQLATSLSLASSINLATTTPTFGAGQNAYGNALAAVSKTLSS